MLDTSTRDKRPMPNNISSIHVDHNHITGEIRGLACRAHNVGLGMFGDNWKQLIKAANYLLKDTVPNG